MSSVIIIFGRNLSNAVEKLIGTLLDTKHNFQVSNHLTSALCRQTKHTQTIENNYTIIKMGSGNFVLIYFIYEFDI